MKTTLDETPVGERGDVVRVGDPVRVLPSRPYKRDGFDAEIRSIAELDGGDIEVTVVGGPTGRPKAFRTFPPTRLAARR